MAGKYRFSFGPWNIHEGADPFGPPVRESFDFDEKLKVYKKLGFQGIQLHDDDAVPFIDNYSPKEVVRLAKELKKKLDDHGLEAEFVAPRLWEDSRTIDGAFTSNDPRERRHAVDRTRLAADIADAVGTNRMVLWLAREGTYIREAKEPARAIERIVEAIDAVLEHNRRLRVLIEPKPNEPMDQAYLPTIGHAVATSYMTRDPKRVGVLLETAHAVLAGLDPSDELGYALAHGKLWSVHLNDQNGLKYDQDKVFGSVDLRRAFNQVRVLDENGYGKNGEYVGLDVKVMRTQKRGDSFKHLATSLDMFKALLEKVRTLDKKVERQYIKERDYEGLDAFILRHLLGVGGKRGATARKKKANKKKK